MWMPVMKGAEFKLGQRAAACQKTSLSPEIKRCDLIGPMGQNWIESVTP
jgi:hypothetical protein